MDVIPNDIWVGPIPKSLGFLLLSGRDDNDIHIEDPIGARMVWKGFQTHDKHTWLTKDNPEPN